MSMMVIIKTTILFILLLGLFVYSKLQPNANVLNFKASKYYSILDRIYRPAFSFFSRNFPSRLKISDNGLLLDLGQIIIFVILLILFRFL